MNIRSIFYMFQGSWRFRWMALFVAWTISVMGLLGILFVPDVYEARARVFVDTSSRLKVVLDNIASDPDLEQRIRMVREAMIGRP